MNYRESMFVTNRCAQEVPAVPELRPVESSAVETCIDTAIRSDAPIVRLNPLAASDDLGPGDDDDDDDSAGNGGSGGNIDPDDDEGYDDENDDDDEEPLRVGPSWVGLQPDPPGVHSLRRSNLC